MRAWEYKLCIPKPILYLLKVWAYIFMNYNLK